MRRLLKEGVNWELTPDMNDDKKVNKEITEAPCLAHFDPDKNSYITTDAWNAGLWATLWQQRVEYLEQEHLQVVF